MMKISVLIGSLVLCILLLSLNFGEIYEYRGVVFYPNGSQNISISKLSFNYENSDMFNLYIFYRNQTFYLPYAENCTFNLPPEKFNISIIISADRASIDKYIIYYKIVNNYPYNISFNISFPSGFNIKNSTVEVPARSYKIITLSKIQNSDFLYFGKSNISFEVPSTLLLRYSVSIPFSITKSNRVLNNGSVEWIAVYTIRNTKNVSLNINASYWAVLDNKKINFGNYSFVLEPGKNISKSFVIINNGTVPAFYLKFYAWRDVLERIKIKPAIKVGNAYVVGIGEVGEASFNIPYTQHHGGESEVVVHKEENNNIIENNKNKNKEIKNSNNQNVPKKENENKKTENPNEITPPHNLKKYPAIVKNIKKDKAKITAITVATITTTSITLMLIPPIFRRRSFIADKGVFSIDELEFLCGVVYVPEGCELGNILPGGLTIVQLSESEKEIARDLHEIYEIPLNSAKAIVIGVKYGGKLYLSNKKACEIAVKVGLEAYYSEVNDNE
ncbi:conserved hypothetical protein [Methanocaldococcus vulcanius M7]|uniref:Uncharacterized protein n=1 Tax=Methanocaldococcus vulcanius (strain ATCC 700851 / DSM 12094 / M7) TaxID=579137 RepID=C9RFD1_METVM|nr:hypothetical protein [Methanocaldococcus vulcanius]ACX72283.1 conserved hypothetical protein [Methanocaldococcus vulcanius M7]